MLLPHEISLPLDIITTRTAIEVWIDSKLSDGTPAVLHRSALPPYAHDHIIPVLVKYEHNGYRVVPVRDGVWVLSVVEKRESDRFLSDLERRLRPGPPPVTARQAAVLGKLTPEKQNGREVIKHWECVG